MLNARLASEHKLLTFVVATFLFQSSIVLSGYYYRYVSPKRTITASTSAPSSESILAEDPFDDVNIYDPTDNLPLHPKRDDVSVPAIPRGPQVIMHKLQSGDTLSLVWKKYGAPDRGAVLAAEAFKKAGVALNTFKQGEEIELQISAAGDVTAIRKKIDEERVLLLEGSSTDGYQTTVIDVPVQKKRRTAHGAIDGSFAASAAEMELPYELVDELVDLFSGRVEFNRDIQPGDSFAVMYTERQAKDGEKLPPGPIRAASLEVDGKMMVAVRHVGKDGKAFYYDEKGEALGDYFLRYPLQFTRISSVFTKSRFHPVLRYNRPHLGVDFAAPTGTPVRAVSDGVISSAGFRGGSGNMVEIRHGDRYSTAYLHLSKIASGIRRGVHVERGKVIGNVGMTGLATGPHLHFSLYDRGKYVDPLGVTLPRQAEAFQKIPRGYLERMLDLLKRSHEKVRYASIQNDLVAVG